MSDLTFGEWAAKRRPAETWKEPKSSFAAWHEKEYGGGSSSAAAAPAVHPTVSRPTASAPAADYSYDYDSRVKELEETKRQATVDMDFNTVNEVDKELKSMRAREGKQTIGDRIGDVIGAASAGTVGAVADTVGTLWELAGGDPMDNPIADIAAADRDRFTQSAEDGLGTAGQFLADTGIAGTNLLTDAAVNALIPGAGLAATGVRSFGSAAREAEEDGASTQEKALYGLGSAAAGMLTEKLGNVGLLKRAYGSSLLKDPALGTLGKLAYSAVSEGAEEFAEGLADPLLKNLTYDPNAVYDDAWLNDTLYDSAVGTALGGLGGAVEVGSEQQKPTSDLEVGRANYDELQASLIRGEHKTFRNLIAGLDAKVSEFFNKWQGGRTNAGGEKLEKLYLGRLSPSVTEKVADIVGYDVDVRDVIVTNDGVKHIFNHHGDDHAEIQRGNIPLEEWMFDKLPELVSNPDSVEAGGLGRGKKNAGKRAVLFSKEFPGGTVVTVQFDNKGRQTMEITTLYARKKGTTSKPYAPVAETSAGRPKRLEPVPFEDSIP